MQPDRLVDQIKIMVDAADIEDGPTPDELTDEFAAALPEDGPCAVQLSAAIADRLGGVRVSADVSPPHPTLLPAH